jgi:protein-tyrosine phosphatase
VIGTPNATSLYARDNVLRRALSSVVRMMCAQFPQPNAVLLVGSAATRLRTANSDVDVVVVTEEPFSVANSCHIVEGTKVDVQLVDAEWLRGVRMAPSLDLSGLRLAGRIATGRLLWSGWSDLTAIRRSVRHVVLDPLETRHLCLGAVAKTRAVLLDSHARPERLYLLLLEAAFAVVILSVALGPGRFQKAKWLARDLQAADARRLRTVLRGLLCGSTASRRAAARMVGAARACIEDACLHLGLPLLRYDRNAPAQYRALFDTCDDARQLLLDGDVDGACLTAAFGLLQAAALAENRGYGGSVPFARRWGIRAIQAIFPASARGTERLRQYGRRLAAETNSVAMRHMRAHERAQTGTPYLSEWCRECGASSLLGVTRVTDRLWFGGLPTDSRALADLGITAVLLTAAECLVRSADLKPLRLMRSPIGDEGLVVPADDPCVEKAVRWAIGYLRRPDAQLLVSCNEGVHRSGLVAACVFQDLTGCTGSEAADHVRRRRNGALSQPEHRVYLLNRRARTDVTAPTNLAGNRLEPTCPKTRDQLAVGRAKSRKSP